MKKEALLKAIAKKLRILSLEMTTRAGSGHPTTCLSMAELMSCLFFDEMRYNIKDPFDPGNDEFVLSKGHASPILWACFAEAGIIREKDLEGYRQINSVLEGHPTPRMPWIKAATGSLGQGLSVGLGMALAMRLQKRNSRVFVMMGDGECAEGNVWEAAELAGKLQVSNITGILDANRLGQSGESLHGHNVGGWERKFSAFGWHTRTIDGHKITEILDALAWAKNTKGPCMIIARTLKGKGVSFLENKEGWHGKALNESQLKRALSELGPMPRVNVKIKGPRKAKRFSARAVRPSRPNYKKGELVATREAFGIMLEKLGKDERVVALDGDVQNSTYTKFFAKSFPKRFFECYIAEQNMVAMAVGFQAMGFVPVASTFAAFFSRAHDQVRMAGISRANIKLVGSHAGISIGADGPSQMGLEDLALFRCIPDSVVLYPCDAVSAEALTSLSIKHKGLSYLRTSRPKTPVIYKKGESFAIGGSKILTRPKRVRAVIIAAGVTVHEALKAAEERKDLLVVDAYSIKPLDEKTIRRVCKGRKVIVVEDHYPEGGLGEAIASLGIPIIHLAPKTLPRSGKPEELMRLHKIDSNAILKAVK
ncbi:transketolase [Candidatus Woesearchaeota archaeon]|nr:MAG: transketolase [Candidatus Woesearchaeota archaeon]